MSHQVPPSPLPDPAGPALFLLSFGARDVLAAQAAAGGWRPVAARRNASIARRFLASRAAVAVVDLRGAWDAGADALRDLAPAVEAQRAALVALIDAADRARAGDLVASGVTHYLAAPFDDADYRATLDLAAATTRRLGGAAGTPTLATEAQGWRWRPAARRLRLTPALAQRLGIEGDGIALARVLPLLGRAGRRAAHGAVSRLLATGRHAAFAHDAGDPVERLVHHLGLDEATGEVTGWIEDLDGAAGEGGVAPEARDPLTGLSDAGEARRWLARRAAQGQRCVLLMLSVSRFDMINAAFGRSVGDALLQGVARRIARLAGPRGRGRLVARLDGPDFLVALAAPAGQEEAEFLAERLTEAIAQPFVAGEHIVTLGCRIGIAAGSDGESAHTLIARAAAALSDARGGDGSVSTLDASRVAAAARDGRLEVDLRRALDGDEIRLLFQPQVDVTTGRIVGAEALARWDHPRLGTLGAAELFAAAERSDYLLELSAHVQQRAVAAVAAWAPRLRACRVAINATPADMAQPGFADRFAAMVDAAGVARGRVTIEITETSLIEDLGLAAALLAALREMGFRVALDDFGTGYSSLAYLKALPLDYLKIDKRLSDDIAGSPRDRVVVRSVIDMARALGLAVIAEGVETEEQLALLAAEGCNLYQGYLCAPPLTSAALARLLARAETG